MRHARPTIRRRETPVSHRLPDDLHPVLQRALAARGVLDAEALDCALEGLYRTDGLAGLSAATARLHGALERDRRILVVGDFDADGATSCAVAVRALRAMGAAHVDYIVPNRFEFGYGLTPAIVEFAAARSPDVLVTVDNGISSIEGVRSARDAGLEVIITDHHLPAAELPAAHAIVNPNLPGDGFPSKCLAGVGVIFYVMLALRARLRECDWFGQRRVPEPRLADLLDLVALGTVADVVPLDQNNRRLVAQGVARIRAGRCHVGIAALLVVSGRAAARVTSSDLAFALGPRLNAAGRLADMSLGIECLISDDAAKCRQIAEQLDRLNRERREIEQDMRDDAFDRIDALVAAGTDGPTEAGMCLFEPSWHQGVVGIVASRIKDRYHRPVVAFAASGDDEIKGSARSVPGVHIRDVLDSIAARYPGLLDRFGGHAMAAGMTLAKTRFEAFRAAFDEEVRRRVGPGALSEVIMTDGALEPADFSLDLARAIARVVPWGQGFPEPLFDGEFTVAERRVVGEAHLRLMLTPAGSTVRVNAIAFGAAGETWAADAPVIRAVYKLSVNYYRDVESLQLVIEYATGSG